MFEGLVRKTLLLFEIILDSQVNKFKKALEELDMHNNFVFIILFHLSGFSDSTGLKACPGYTSFSLFLTSSFLV